MKENINCVYKTPCDWCSKWNKKCDKKIGNPIGGTTHIVTNKACTSDSDHEWECTGMSTAGTTYRCKKCYATKTIPVNFNNDITITI